MDFKTFEHSEAHNGDQYITFFDNGYGVSVIRHDFSYGTHQGLWEIAPLEGKSFTDSVLLNEEVTGHLTEEEVNEFCLEISKR